MAFFVCFKAPGSLFNWKDKAIYLNTEFYELIFNKSEKDSILNEIANLGYGDELEVKYASLNKLKFELIVIHGDERCTEISNFIEVINRSISSKYSLMIAGDMPFVLS